MITIIRYIYSKLFYFEIPHLRDLGVGHFKKSLGLGTPGTLGAWALQKCARGRPGEEEVRARRRVEFKI